LIAHISTHRQYERCLWQYRHWSEQRKLTSDNDDSQVILAKLGQMKKIADWLQLSTPEKRPNNSLKNTKEQRVQFAHGWLSMAK
jgi:beta-lactamase class A